MHGMRPSDRVRAGLGQSNLAHKACFDEIRDCSDCLLDWHRGINARGLIEIDVVRIEAFQGISKKVLDASRASVNTNESASRVTQSAKLHGDECILPMAVQRSAQQVFVVTHTVKVACVEEGNTGFERGLYRRDAFLFICRTIEIRHAHQSETEGGNLGTVLPDCSSFHTSPKSLVTNDDICNL